MNLALFFDGTWNAPDDKTNAFTLSNLSLQDADQKVKYIIGVGAAPVRGLFGMADRLLGGAFGDGLSENIKLGYTWLCQNFEPGAKIYVVGFSRGAYSARSLAGLVRKCGILRDSSDAEVDAAYAIYRDDTPATDPKTADFRATHSVETDIEFVGVWDTVGELGIPLGGVTIPGFAGHYKFHDTTLGNTTRAAYHAIAANEFRSLYAPTLWTEAPDDTPTRDPSMPVEQRWFMGAHANVGGGYTSPPLNPEDLLPSIPAAWLLDMAVKHGLKTSGAIDVSPAAFQAQPIDSYEQFVKDNLLLRQVCHRQARIANTTSTHALNQTVDPSLLARLKAGDFLAEFPVLRDQLMALPPGA
jgi:hypothetical protein